MLDVERGSFQMQDKKITIYWNKLGNLGTSRMKPFGLVRYERPYYL